MGLNTSHGAYNGPYSSFNEYRREVAKIVGINLYNMVGYGWLIEWGKVTDNVKILLAHSDCNGEISYEDCKLLSDRLKELLIKVPDKKEPFSLYNFIDQFIKGCDIAYSEKENLRFG